MLLTKNGLWIKQDIDNQQHIIQALRIDKKNQKLLNVTFYSLDKSGIFQNRIYAKSAQYTNLKWRLHNATLSNSDAINTRLPNNYIIKSSLTFKQIEESIVNPESLSFWSLPSYISIAEISGFQATRYKLQFLDLLFKPFFFAVMLVLGAAFSINHPRLGNSVRMNFYAVLLGFIIYFLTDLIYAFAISHKISLIVAAITPPSICLFISSLIILFREEGN